ncbi:MAG TPA: M23 family metallopeptidase [Bacteroidales bacterium]|nr:M23 family metallopeptidase [Bacteroidales bacterium]
MPDHKYFLDITDLQYKQVKLAWKDKFMRIFLWLTLSIAIAVLYGIIFKNIFGSPKEKVLSQEIEDLKLQYTLLERQVDNSEEILKGLKLSDDSRYRPVLDMDTIPESYRKAGYGGVNRFEDLAGYDNTDLMVSFRERIQDIRNRSTVQYESFKSITEQTEEWEREMEYLPMICPVNVIYRRGDGMKYREVHPVLGTPQWHHGQDFSTPYGTEVYATGSGRVIEAGWNGGFGNCIVIDHGYGYQSTYGHLSNIRVSVGMNVKRGDHIALTGSTGTSSGPHLHYQIDLYGKHKNPLYFFNDDLTEDEYFEMIQTLTSQSKFR